VVADMRNSRFSVWTDEGEHVADHATPLGFRASRMAGLAGGGMVILGPQVDMGAMTAGEMPSPTTVLATYGGEGEQLVRIVEPADFYPQKATPSPSVNTWWRSGPCLMSAPGSARSPSPKSNSRMLAWERVQKSGCAEIVSRKSTRSTMCSLR